MNIIKFQLERIRKGFIKECPTLRESMDEFGLREQIFTEEGNIEWLNYWRGEREQFIKNNNIYNIVSICHLIKYKKR